MFMKRKSKYGILLTFFYDCKLLNFFGNRHQCPSGVEHIRIFMFVKTSVKRHSVAYQSPKTSRKCDGLLYLKPGFEPQARHQKKYEKYFFGDFRSADFWQKL